MRYITKKKRRYVVDIQRKGNRIRESFPTEVEAQEFRDRILVQYGDVTQTEPLPQEGLEPSEHEETQAETTSMSPLNPPPLQSDSPPAEILELIKQALGGTERLIEIREYQDALREVKCIRAILTRRKYI
jgi:hypothetical protein